MRLRLVGTLLLLVIGIGAVGYVVFQPGAGNSSNTRYTTATASVTNVVKAVVATGTVEPVNVYNLQFGANATLLNSASSGSSSGSGSNSSSGSSTTWKVATVSATPGQAVHSGDVLATADTSSAQLALTVAQANLASAQARLKTDQQGLTPTDKAAAALSVTQASQSLSQAQVSRSQTNAQNSLKLSQANQAVTAAKSKYNTDKAATNPATPPAQLTQDLAAITAAEQQVASLRLQIQQSSQQATNQVNSASMQLQSARLAYASKIQPATSATIASDKAAIATAQQAVDNAQTSLGFSQLTSPVDGIVLAVNITAGVDAPSSDAITIQSTGFQVSASVAEADLPSLKLGQDSTVTLTASGLTADGKVTQITPTGSGGSSGGVVSFPIIVSLPTPPAGTASGMSASISITTAQAANVLAVPAIALVGSATNGYEVRVLDSTNQVQLVPVQVGLVTSSLAEIQSGISSGQVVVTGTSSTRNATTGTGGAGGFPGVGGGGGGGQFRINGGG